MADDAAPSLPPDFAGWADEPRTSLRPVDHDPFSFSSPLTDQDQSVVTASRTAPAQSTAFDGGLTYQPTTPSAWDRTKPVSKDNALWDAIEVPQGEAERPADSYGQVQRGTLTAGPAPTQRDLLADYLTGDKPSFERAHFVQGANNLLGMTPPGAISDALDAAKNSDWGSAALDAAGVAPLGKAAALTKPVLSIFGGVGAKTADRGALMLAQEMAERGIDKNEIWKKTGWFKNEADNRWRFEIPDNTSQIGRIAAGDLTLDGEAVGKAPQVILHDKLYGAYPDLKDAVVSANLGAFNKPRGQFVPFEDMAPDITAASNELKGPSGVHGILLHELQHGVQESEGFAPGSAIPEITRGTPAWDVYQKARNDIKEHMASMGLSGPIPKDLDDQAKMYVRQFLYQRSAGEVEARNVQKRMAMTPEERVATPPWETQDFPYDKQIVRQREGVTPQLSLEPVDHDPFVASPKRGDLNRSTELPDIRNLPVDEATKIAQRDPHLIKSGEQSEGYFIGSPRDINSKRGLTNQRNAFDQYVAADPRGGDWYDRYRKSIAEVTGDNPLDNEWMAKQHGQWSAGVSPEGELGFTLKENNGALAGMPVKSARPAQHEAFMRAIEANDPNELQLGQKTGMYAQKINPDQPMPPGATGVNDFRYARQWGYTEANDDPQRGALTNAQHRFLDYETANAVARANKAGLGGRTDWTGEALQAAPWVRQKAESILEQRPAILQARLDAGLSPEAARAAAYEDAFQIANTTIGDYFPKHTAFGTHEAIPGADTGHLPGSVAASPEERAAYSADPRSTWANAPGGRDAVYSGLRAGDTGVSARVRPTVEMQGLYTPPGGAPEANPGFTARPLVGFDSGKVKTVPSGDRALLDAGEAVRGYVDAQNAAAWHKPWTGGEPGGSNSYFLPMNRMATRDELRRLSEVMGAHGLGDVVDTGRGITVTSFYPGAPKLDAKGRKAVETALKDAAPADVTEGAKRTSVDSGYHDFVPAWKAGEGSGAATRQMLQEVTKTPELRAAFNNNPYLPKNALDRMARDSEWAEKWGATRRDIQNARRIIGQGPGWIERLEKGLKHGGVLPGIGAAILAPLAAFSSPPTSDRRGA
jgi:hypothetical protein